MARCRPHQNQPSCRAINYIGNGSPIGGLPLAGGEDGSGAVSDTHYRMVRNRPLLMIHSLEPRDGALTGPIAAFGVSFPYGDYATTINVVVNKVWLQHMQGYSDDPDEEEDYDA